MRAALLVRLRPAGPWRYGPDDGAPSRVDALYRSDRLFSAVTLAMQRLGHIGEWLDATANSTEPAVSFSSLFPFQGDVLFAIPPATLWPPPSGQITAPNPVFLSKIRWEVARFVPLTIIDALASGGRILADQWLPDPGSACLLRRDRPSTSPFRVTQRRFAAVDRLAQSANSVVSCACVEFEPGAGLWTVIRYRDTSSEEVWNERLQASFRLLADSGFGGRRTSGWGQALPPEFQKGAWPSLLVPKLGRLNSNGSAIADEAGENSRFWLLSLYSPSQTDRVDWGTGAYELTTRSGHIESNFGPNAKKKAVRMIGEGSVLVAEREPCGTAVNVAPDGFEHPVYRSGLALTLKLPTFVPQTEDIDAELRPAEEPYTEEAIIEHPCEEPQVGDQNAEETSREPEEPELESAELGAEPGLSSPQQIAARQNPDPGSEVPVGQEETVAQKEPIQNETARPEEPTDAL